MTNVILHSDKQELVLAKCALNSIHISDNGLLPTSTNVFGLNFIKIRDIYAVINVLKITNRFIDPYIM